MKTYVIIIAIVIIVSMGIYAYTQTEAGEGKYTDDTEFGAWGQELTLVYEDGTTRQLNALSFYDSGKKVGSFEYKLYARATSTTHESIAIDVSDFELVFKISNTAFEHIVTFESQETISTDGEWHIVIEKVVTVSDSLDNSLDNGDYELTIDTEGTLSYSYGTGTFTDSALPMSISETFKIVNTLTYTLKISNADGSRVEYARVYDDKYFAQTFKATDTFDIGKISLHLGRWGTVYSITLSLREDSPSGNEIAKVVRSSSGIPSNWAVEQVWADFVFDNPVELTPRDYAMVLSVDAGWQGDIPWVVCWTYQIHGEYADGAYYKASKSGDIWTISDRDFLFKVWAILT